MIFMNFDDFLKIFFIKSNFLIKKYSIKDQNIFKNLNSNHKITEAA